MVILTDLSDVLIHGLYEIEGIFAERYDQNVARIFGQRHLETEEDFNELMGILQEFIDEDQSNWEEYLCDDWYRKLDCAEDFIESGAVRLGTSRIISALETK